MIAFVIYQVRLERKFTSDLGETIKKPGVSKSWDLPRPGCWLAVRSPDLSAVQAAIGMHHPKPCSWHHGLAGEETLFMAPPVKGWILITGSRLPEPDEDVDACYRFLVELSRKVGDVQFFSANRFSHHHAWVRVDHGHVVRAYAWAGSTIWNQGEPTAAEKELDLHCFDYAEPHIAEFFGDEDVIASNAEKVSALAARWSFDPAQLDEMYLEKAQGVADEPASHD